MALTFIIGGWNYFVIAKYISTHRLAYFNLWEANTQRRSSENTFHETNCTALNIPIHDRILLTSLFNETTQLGNFLFKFASSYGIAKANEFTLRMEVSTNLKTVFENITLNIPSSQEVYSCKKNLIKHVREPGGSAIFNPNVFNLHKKYKKTDVIKISGYRQSWRYFAHTWTNDLKYRLKFSSFTQSKINHYLDSVLSEKLRDTSLVGIHIRRGDFEKQARLGYTVSNITYIEKAIQYYEKQTNEIVFIIATQDLLWTKQYVLPLHKQIVMSPFTSPFDDMCLLASCNDSIITGGSFGWWSAYLAGGSVVYDKMFPKSDSPIGRKFKKEDYYPPRWVGL